MAGRLQLLGAPGGVLAAVAQRTRYVIIRALAAVGPALAVLLFALLFAGCLLWQAAVSWSSTTR
eukprot:12821583-Alexandrium_andersonii.AAC.1